MQIIFRTNKEFLLRPELEDFFRKRMEKLEKFSGGAEPIKMELEIRLADSRLRKGSLFQAKASAALPRKTLRAIGEGRTIKDAMIEVRDELEEQFKKYATQPAAKRRAAKKMPE
jgi:ribosome-associated translation inhibitor RaiA